MCDLWPRICFRWCRTVNTKSTRIKLIPSFLKNRSVDLTWDQKKLLYLSEPTSTPCGRHSAQFLIDGNLYPCDNFNVASSMFEVNLYVRDSSSEEDDSRSSWIHEKKFQHDSVNLKSIIPLSLSQDSGIQEMNLDNVKIKAMGIREEKDKKEESLNLMHTHFADVDENLDKLRLPSNLNWNLNRSQSVGSINQMCVSNTPDPQTSTPVHRSVEKLVIVMPADMEHDEGKKKYLKKCVQIERNLDCSLTTIEKSVAVLKDKTEICRGSEKVVEYSPNIIGMESLKNITMFELRDEESQTGQEEEKQDEDVADEEEKVTEEEMVAKFSYKLGKDDEINKTEEDEEDEQEISIPNNICESRRQSSQVTSGISGDIGEDENEIENEIDNEIEDEIENDVGEGEIMEVVSVNSDDGNKNALEVMKERVMAREEQVRQLEQEISLLDESRENLQKENLELIEQENSIKERYFSPLENNQENEDRVVLSKEIDQLKTKVASQEKANAALEWEIKTLRSKLDSNDPNEVIQLIEEMKVLRDELMSLAGKNKDLFGEIVDLREENMNLKKNSSLGVLKEIPSVGIASSSGSSTTDETEYREFPVEGTQSFGVQTDVTALEKKDECENKKWKENRKYKTKKKKKIEMSTDDSGSSTDSLIARADNFLRQSMSEFIDVEKGSKRDHSKKGHRKVIRAQSSSIYLNDPPKDGAPGCDCKRTCRILPKLSPFIPKSHLDINIGCRVKFIHPVNLLVMEGLVRFVGLLALNPNVVHVGVELDQPLGDCDGSFEGTLHFKCESNHGIFIPMRKIIIAWGNV